MSGSTNVPSTATRSRERDELLGARVLVVDDDCALRKVMAVSLAERGCRVHQLGSGVDLTRVVETITTNAWPDEGVDLIVIDLKMPGIDGIEALRALRASGDSTPVLLITAFPEPEARSRAAALGIPLLAKPFRLSALLRRVEELTSGAAGRMDQRSV